MTGTQEEIKQLLEEKNDATRERQKHRAREVEYNDTLAELGIPRIC